MINKIKHAYFPKAFILITPISILFAVSFYYSYYPLTGIIVCLIGILMGILAITTFYVTEFNLNNAFYTDYILVLGVRINCIKNTLKKVEKIIIIRAHDNYTVRFPGAQPYQVNLREFTAILIHENDRLTLMTMKNKKKLVKEIKVIARFFKTYIEDKSVRYPYVIDLEEI